MSEEKNPLPEQKPLHGWKGVVFTDEMPVRLLVNALNVLNQRLCAIEDIVTTQYEGKAISLTALYDIQATLAQAQAQAQAAQAAQAQAAQKPADKGE